ncbi:MAG: hypothetical protein A2516_12040 [Alphaproteobacteria bacterium RIFOXYD12_FULL_60_8]|nr:MAG: hypothetical protein A2516_12040 [Alphaproteobacteria bacterium RIFOXYD12_FULL_60_8]
MVKRVVPWVLKLSLSGGMIYYVSTKIDLEASWAKARSLDPTYLLLAIVLLIVQLVLGSERWRAALRGLGEYLSPGQAFRFQYISLFFNLALPGMVGGDALRVWKAHKTGLGFAPAFNSVVLERAATVLGLAVLVTAMEPFLYARIGDHSLLYLFPLLTLGGVLGLGVLMVLDRLPPRFRAGKIVGGLAHLAKDTRRVFLSPLHGGAVLGLAILGHMNVSLVAYLLALGLDMPVSVLDCLVLIPPVILAATLPLSISGWGLREGAMVAAFGMVGVPAESSVVLSVVFGLVTMGIAVPGGAFWLADKERAQDIPDLIEDAEAAENEDTPA